MLCFLSLNFLPRPQTYLVLHCPLLMYSSNVRYNFFPTLPNSKRQITIGWDIMIVQDSSNHPHCNILARWLLHTTSQSYFLTHSLIKSCCLERKTKGCVLKMLYGEENCIVIPLKVTLQVFMINPAQLRNHDFHPERLINLGFWSSRL